jgi:hypothetical protein
MAVINLHFEKLNQKLSSQFASLNAKVDDIDHRLTQLTENRRTTPPPPAYASVSQLPPPPMSYFNPHQSMAAPVPYPSRSVPPMLGPGSRGKSHKKKDCFPFADLIKSAEFHQHGSLLQVFFVFYSFRSSHSSARLFWSQQRTPKTTT